MNCNIWKKHLEKLSNKKKYFYTCYKNRNDEKFFRHIYEYKKNQDILLVKHLGNKNENRIIYIANCGKETGFFSQHRTMLKALLFADHFGFVPVVEYSKNFAYALEEDIDGISNPFEYYFKRVSNISLEEAYQSKNVVFFDLSHESKFSDVSQNYFITDKELKQLAYAQKKYITLKDDIKEEIMLSINSRLNGKKTLGIHVRGTDYNQSYDGHPKAVNVNMYYKYIDQALKTYNYQQIFLATDDIRILKTLKEKYGEEIVFYDHIRSKDNISVAYSIGNDKKYPYQIGYEVLLDMMTLASCHGLIAGLSQVSIIARVEKESRGEKFDYLHIINRGINCREGHNSINAQERKRLRSRR